MRFYSLIHESEILSTIHFIISIQCTVFIQYSTLQGKTKKEGTDSLTLVNVFILYIHCHKYRIYFYPEVPTTKSQGWVPTKHTTVRYKGEIVRSECTVYNSTRASEREINKKSKKNLWPKEKMKTTGRAHRGG